MLHFVHGGCWRDIWAGRVFLPWGQASAAQVASHAQFLLCEQLLQCLASAACTLLSASSSRSAGSFLSAKLMKCIVVSSTWEVYSRILYYSRVGRHFSVTVFLSTLGLIAYKLQRAASSKFHQCSNPTTSLPFSKSQHCPLQQGLGLSLEGLFLWCSVSVVWHTTR